ncbi:DUF3298 domain-containing protein [Microvirga sp. STR05]|uniref:DUF3298 domain-containing protein n=1 Tax=Hymenobacter duratus TaxID=2771356 RepID=A0ABR8JDE3_9BACT|nr:DUF3298 and DUF4163 domain-containing protein [Hymenobacter duratus]MBD2714859.1 DUF3298 domain-containing protein [Hymenobacter duratus]MBR7949764.1 DUF3298 domain-containing protein [Microvirga sp. STR05]
MSFISVSPRASARVAVLLLSGWLVACQSNSDSQSGAATSTAEKPGHAPETTAARDSPGAWYRQYRGVLPGSPDSITLQLQAWPRTSSGDSESTGLAASYAGSDGQTFELYGETSASSDSIRLTDSTPEHAGADYSRSIAWRLKRQGTELLGTVGVRPVRLRQVQPTGSVRLVSHYFLDSVAAFPKLVGTPYAHQRMLAVLPTGGASATAQATLRDNLLRGLRDDTVDTKAVPQLGALWRQQKQRYTADYRQDADASKPAPGDTTSPEFGIGLRYDEQQLMHVLWNQAPLLSLGYYNYSYTGGAHGLYGTTVATFDTRTGRRLRYDDIFRAGTRAQLMALLDNAARRAFRLAPNAPLDKTLFVKQLPVTRNVFLTSGGATFVYTPYEIASYAQGEIRLFVPLSELRPLLKPGLPVPVGGEVTRP